MSLLDLREFSTDERINIVIGIEVVKEVNATKARTKLIEGALDVSFWPTKNKKFEAMVERYRVADGLNNHALRVMVQALVQSIDNNESRRWAFRAMFLSGECFRYGVDNEASEL